MQKPLTPVPSPTRSHPAGRGAPPPVPADPRSSAAEEGWWRPLPVGWERVGEGRGEGFRWAALGLALLTACSSPSPKKATYDAEYLLLDHLDTVETVEESSQPLKATRWEIGYDQRPSLFQHPPSAVRFAGVPSGPGAVFHAAPVIEPKAWEKPTDGAGFTVLCRTAGDKWETLAELTVDPASVPEDRAWQLMRAPLDRCSQPATELELRTDCGPKGRCAADWTAWGEPKVVYPKTLALRPERLVLLISIDTLRPDRLGLYGGPRPTSPEIGRLAADGVVFETAVASSPWTIPSHATLLTSTYPQVHGATARSPIPETVPRLAEVLREAGWQTAGFVDTPYLHRGFGFDRGFEHYDDGEAPKGDFRRGARATRQRLLDWLGDADERPAFVFWHLMDVHGPYGAPSPHGGRFRAETALAKTASAEAGAAEPDGRLELLRRLGIHDYLRLERYRTFDDLVASYDEGIAFVDEVLGGLFDVLRDTGTYESAAIAVTSDHGESLLDHGVWVGHGLFLTDDELRVPLVVKLPGNRWAGRRVEEMVGQIDLAPTLLDAAGVAAPAAFQGRSLVSPAPGESGSLPEIVYGYSSNLGAPFLRTRDLKYIGAAESTPDKVVDVHLRGKGDVELPLPPLLGEQVYHLRRDPGETRSLAAATEPAKLEQLRQLLADHAADSAARHDGEVVEAPALSEEARENLRALGYLD